MCGGTGGADLRPQRRTVYPRVCGGTAVTADRDKHIPGLSPRVRGNPTDTNHTTSSCGSIPACAGEPLDRLGGGVLRRVYPRVCGGTDTLGSPFPSVDGLSPRVRGNHSRSDRALVGRGSIPACAGEPQHRRGRPCPTLVYPRVCGGTLSALFPLFRTRGLSPRVRGNRRGRRRGRRRRRSIPACAGEPHRRSPETMVYAVYPRVCGGTL